MAKNEVATSQASSADTALTLFTETDALYDDMLATIASARDSVWLETYIFSADEIGWRFAKALVERARAGVDVRLRVDSAGAFESGSLRRIRRYLTEGGVDLRWFNRLRRLLPSRLNHRDHRKLLMVDARRIYLGSSNIMAGNSRRLCGDTCRYQIDVRVDGALAERMGEEGTVLWQTGGEREAAWQPVAEGESQIVASAPGDDRRPLCTLYRAQLDQARSSVHLASGYFVPDEDTVRALEAAAGRGVDVRLILTRQTDLPPTRWAAHAYYARLLAAGVRIYEYLPSVLHVKAIVVDSAWANVGSGNVDYRSFFLNYELNLETRDAAFCRELQQALLDDLARCEEITAQAWSRRPWQDRAREKLVWPARGHL